MGGLPCPVTSGNSAFICLAKGKMNGLIENQVTELLKGEGERLFTFKLPGGDVPMRIRRVANCKELLIMFHGAMDRGKRQLPFFNNFVNELKSVTQLSIADPSMLIDKTHAASWYAGHEGLESQKILPEIFREIMELGHFKRIVFLGGSAGGFASLFYSSFLPESIAIACAPQTIIKYGQMLVKYRENCWPSLTNNEQLAERICLNLCEFYSAPKPNTIIYVQSAGDHGHNQRHLAPFLASVAKVKGQKIILNSGFWGTLGHSGSAPSIAFLPWVKAAFAAQSTEVDDILVTYHSLFSHTGSVKKSDSTEHIEVGAEDLNFSKLIHDYQMRQVEN